MNDQVNRAVDTRPARGHQHNDGNTACREVLLISEIRISRDQQGEAFSFSRIEQTAILELCPTTLVRGDNLMLRQESTQRYRGTLIEQNTHLRRCKRTPRRVLQHCADLFNGDTWEPFDKLRYQRTVFEVLEQCCNRHPGTGEHPSAANSLRIALNRRT